MKVIADVHRLAVDVDDVDSAYSVTTRQPLPGIWHIGRIVVGDYFQHAPSLCIERDHDKTICSGNRLFLAVLNSRAASFLGIVTML
ncbi:MAG: hypothetical protein EOP02_00240 [Proteobacteria bacterium]|nr:MAG: hypothetical protein EOP02_00240 [Pseudomonadota bacterium]